MGFFERMGLVEREEPIVPEYEPIPMPVVEVEANIQSAENVVEAIYEQNGMSDKSTSIYTVQALISTLPQEMTMQKMQTTVAGILSVSGKAVSDLLADAQRRVDVLNAARCTIVDERETEITAAKADIENLKVLIESATVKIHEAEKIIETTQHDIDAECDAIASLVAFCNGMTEGTT